MSPKTSTLSPREKWEAERERCVRHPSVPVERHEAQLRRFGETDAAWRARLASDPHVQAAREKFLAQLRTLKPRQMPRDPNPNRNVPRDDAAFCSACWQAPDACECPTPEHWETA